MQDGDKTDMQRQLRVRLCEKWTRKIRGSRIAPPYSLVAILEKRKHDRRKQADAETECSKPNNDGREESESISHPETPLLHEEKQAAE